MAVEYLLIVISSKGITITTVKDNEVVIDYKVGNQDVIVNEGVFNKWGGN